MTNIRWFWNAARHLHRSKRLQDEVTRAKTKKYGATHIQPGPCRLEEGQDREQGGRCDKGRRSLLPKKG